MPLPKWLSGPNRAVKLFILAVPAAALAAWALVGSFGREGDWVCLVEGKDAGLRDQVRQKLVHKGIAVEAKPHALYVKKQDQSRAVLTLAGEGVFADQDLFRFLEDSSFTSSSWQMDKRWQVALQRKLENMIRELDSIQEARVQITPGTEAKTLGVRDAEGGKASVVVTLKPGRAELGPSEIQGIAHLVAAGVRGLKAENVKIMDRLGRLYTGGDDSRWAGVSDRRSVERRYEKDLEEKARRVIGSFYPQASVSASVKLSSRRIVQRETQVAPQEAGKFVEETHISLAGMKGQRSLLLPELPAVEGASHETRRQVEIEPGEIEHASMAIAVPMEQPPESSAAEESRIRRLVESATGVAASDISVQLIPVARRTNEESAPASAPESFSPVWIAVGLLIVGIFAGYAFGRRRPARLA